MCIYHHLSMLCTLLLLSYFYHLQAHKDDRFNTYWWYACFCSEVFPVMCEPEKMMVPTNVLWSTRDKDNLIFGSFTHGDIVSHMLLCANRYYELKPDDPPYAAKFYDCCGAEDPVIPGCCTSFHVSYDDPWNLINKRCSSWRQVY